MIESYYMARFLLLAKDLTNAGKFEGDPVSIKDDNDTVTTPSGTWYWSAEEDTRRWVAEGNDENDFPNLFYAIDIVGMSKPVAERLNQDWVRAAVDGDPEFENPDEADRFVFLGPNRWQFGVADKLPGQLKTRLRRDRFLDVPFDIDEINSYVTDRSGLDVWITDTPIDPQPPA